MLESKTQTRSHFPCGVTGYLSGSSTKTGRKGVGRENLLVQNGSYDVFITTLDRYKRLGSTETGSSPVVMKSRPSLSGGSEDRRSERMEVLQKVQRLSP